jgi:hypothetical protein
MQIAEFARIGTTLVIKKETSVLTQGILGENRGGTG